jgi:hypothetical protein
MPRAKKAPASTAPVAKKPPARRPAKGPAPPPPPPTNEARVLALIESLRQASPVDTRDEAIGQLALTLAKALDEGAGMATAAVARELRATLADLARDRDDGDDDDWTSGLPAPVWDAKEP